jgi:hypothetical protein
VKRVGIIGASGYTGAELLRLCAQHPEFEVVYATGDTQAGSLASVLYPSLAAHYPGVRLAQLWQGTLTPRQLTVYLRHLPLNSPLGVAVQGDAARWGKAEYLLATVIDVLQGGNWQRGGGKGAKPKPVKRPDPRAEQRKHELVARLKRMGHI